MKKMMAALSALVLMMSVLAGALAAEGFDMSEVESNTKYYTVDVDRDSDVAFIESTLTREQLSFVHKYESEYRYSSTHFDVLAIDYRDDSKRYPVPRLWVTWCAGDYQNIESVTFEIEGREFTFSDCWDREWRTKDEKGVVEELLIKMGTENADFMMALNSYAKNNQEAIIRDPSSLKIPITLHGNEDIRAELSGYFMQDYMMIIVGAYYNHGGLETIDKVNSTPMTVR